MGLARGNLASLVPKQGQQSGGLGRSQFLDVPREDEGGDGNGETLKGILDATRDEVRNIER
ncbi:MAG: hypothetical protein ACKN9D_06080, partial [Actinomycetales bacterium]